MRGKGKGIEENLSFEPPLATFFQERKKEADSNIGHNLLLFRTQNKLITEHLVLQFMG